MPKVCAVGIPKPYWTNMNTPLMEAVSPTVGLVTQQLCWKSGSRRESNPVSSYKQHRTLCVRGRTNTTHPDPTPLAFLDSLKQICCTHSKHQTSAVKYWILLYTSIVLCNIDLVLHWHQLTCFEKHKVNSIRITSTRRALFTHKHTANVTSQYSVQQRLPVNFH